MVHMHNNNRHHMKHNAPGPLPGRVHVYDPTVEPSAEAHRSNTAGGSPAMTLKRPDRRRSQGNNAVDSALAPDVKEKPTAELV